MGFHVNLVIRSRTTVVIPEQLLISLLVKIRCKVLGISCLSPVRDTDSLNVPRCPLAQILDPLVSNSECPNPPFVIDRELAPNNRRFHSGRE